MHHFSTYFFLHHHHRASLVKSVFSSLSWAETFHIKLSNYFVRGVLDTANSKAVSIAEGGEREEIHEKDHRETHSWEMRHHLIIESTYILHSQSSLPLYTRIIIFFKFSMQHCLHNAHVHMCIWNISGISVDRNNISLFSRAAAQTYVLHVEKWMRVEREWELKKQQEGYPRHTYTRREGIEWRMNCVEAWGEANESFKCRRESWHEYSGTII